MEIVSAIRLLGATQWPYARMSCLNRGLTRYRLRLAYRHTSGHSTLITRINSDVQFQSRPLTLLTASDAFHENVCQPETRAEAFFSLRFAEQPLRPARVQSRAHPSGAVQRIRPRRGRWVATSCFVVGNRWTQPFGTSSYSVCQHATTAGRCANSPTHRKVRRERSFHPGQPSQAARIAGAPPARVVLVRNLHRQCGVSLAAPDRGAGTGCERAENRSSGCVKAPWRIRW